METYLLLMIIKATIIPKTYIHRDINSTSHKSRVVDRTQMGMGDIDGGKWALLRDQA